MQEKFKSIKSTPISKQVAEQIKNLILEGNLAIGEKLPSERELSKMIGIGRLSLREGLRILESAGILETKYGVRSGTYVSQVGLENITEKFLDFLKLSNTTIDQLTEARLEISLINLKYFIERATEEDLRALEDCLKDAENLFQSGFRTREKNIYFHQLIARGSKNPIFILLHNALLEILKQFLSKFDSPPEHSKKVLENNKRILRCLKEKNLNEASLAMRNYLAYTGERLKSLTNEALKPMG
jgi:GntR family transcriptional repressor for pyruvate dehydrogenase complex